MREAYLKYYDRYHGVAPLVFTWHMLRARGKRRRLALSNRLRNYTLLMKDERLRELHRHCNAALLQAAREWDSYDYGEGYLYQGLRALGFSGLRDTDERVRMMGLRERLAGRTVLEIGCNTGFLTLALADVADRVIGFDVNPHLIDIARAGAAYLGAANVEFHVSAFEEFRPPCPVDAVLSFANHSTYDGNTRQPLEEYFGKCRALLEPGGLFLFESHPPEHEGAQLPVVRDIIADLFTLQEETVLDYGTFLDRNRTFIVAALPPGPAASI